MTLERIKFSIADLYNKPAIYGGVITHGRLRCFLSHTFTYIGRYGNPILNTKNIEDVVNFFNDNEGLCVVMQRYKNGFVIYNAAYENYYTILESKGLTVYKVNTTTLTPIK